MAEARDVTVRVLLIEDNTAYAKELVDAFAALSASVVVAQSRDSALEALEQHDFDLIICDLDLPAADGDLHSSIDHGDSVRERAETEAPGTPIIVHSAFGTVPYLERMIREARTEDLYGNGTRQPLVDFIRKDDTPKLVREVDRVRRELMALQDIEIVSEPAFDPALGPYEARALAIFARRCHGRRIDVTPLKGGLSGSKVLRVRVQDDHGTTRAAVVAKVDQLPAIRDEIARFRAFVGPALRFGRFPNLADEVVSGAGTLGAVIYSVAGEHDRSLFAVLEETPEHGERLVNEARNIVRRWEEEAPVRTLELGDIRRRHIPDDRLDPRVTAILGDIEGRMVQVRDAIQHGDLHGSNLLFDRDLNPAIIDFGNVCSSLAGYDAVTLELSLIFHPEGRARCGDWPSEEDALRWNDIDAYVAKCPYGAFVRACRTWAHQTAHGPRAVLAAAYTHVAKQFRYPDTPTDIATAILRGIRRVWDG